MAIIKKKDEQAGSLFFTSLNKAHGKREKLVYPKVRLDIAYKSYKGKIIICEKPKSGRHSTEKQEAHRDRFKEADCIFQKLTIEQRLAVKQWATKQEEERRKGWTDYNYFMNALLTNDAADLLENYLNTTLTDLYISFTKESVVITAYITRKDLVTPEGLEEFFEPKIRRS